MYRFTSLGVDEESPCASNSTVAFDEDGIITDHSALVRFCPRVAHRNLEVCDQIQNLACITDMVVADLVGDPSGGSQLYLTCGKGNCGTLRQLTHGLTVIEMATSPMPRKPTRVMTLEAKIGDALDKYLIVSFTDSSLVLGINEGKIAPIKASGFQENELTLHVGILEDGSYFQVTPTGIVHVRAHLSGSSENVGRASVTWKCDSGRKIHAAASNSR